MPVHQIVISWTASPDSPADSYNIYRATTAGAEGSNPYATVAAGIVTFTDTNVQPGPYFYTVKSVANGVVALVATNELSVSVPPAPATNLVLVSVS